MKKNLITIVALATALVACNKTEAPVAEVGAPVQFRASVANEYVVKSTTIDNPVDDGAFVGIYASAPINVSNKKYAKTASAMTLTPEDGQTINWLVGQNGTQDFYAYYPYKDGATESSIPVTINTNQTTLANLNASDFLWGSDVGRAANAASSITLNHKLTKVIINIDNNLAQDVTGVEITGLKNTTTATPSTGALGEMSGSGNIQAYQNADQNGWSDGDGETDDTRNRQYVAIVLPEASVSPTIVITVANSLVYTYSLSGAYSFVAGTTATADITIEPGASEAGSAASFNFSVGTWASGSSIGIASGTPTPTKPENKWSIIGTINGSNWNQDFYLTQTATGTNDWEGTWEGDFTYASGNVFKLRFNNGWTRQAGMRPTWSFYQLGDFTPDDSTEHGWTWNEGGIDFVLSSSSSSYVEPEAGDYHVVFYGSTYKMTVTKK